MNFERKKKKENLHTSIRRNMTVVYNVEALKDHHQNKKVLKELYDEEYLGSTKEPAYFVKDSDDKTDNFLEESSSFNHKRHGRTVPDYSGTCSDSFEEESEHEERTYDSLSCNHVNCQKDPNKKAGQYMLCDEGRREIDFVYNEMKEGNMWKLSSGSAVHSFIIDVDDEIIKNHFNEDER